MVKIMLLMVGGYLASAISIAPKDVVAGSSDAPKFQATDAPPVKAPAAKPADQPTAAAKDVTADSDAGRTATAKEQNAPNPANPNEATAYAQAPNLRPDQPEPEVSYTNGMVRAKAKNLGYSTVPHADPKSGRYVPPKGYDDYSGEAYDYDGKNDDPKTALKNFPQFNYTPTNNCKIKSDQKGSDKTLAQLWPGRAEIPKNFDCGFNAYKNSKPDSFMCMVCNIYFEAGIEKPPGQIEVGRSTLTRVFNKRWPGNICKVVYQSDGHTAQFSWVYEKKDHHLPPIDQLKNVIESARQAMALGPNCNANYWSPDGMKPKGSKPVWAGQCSPQQPIGRQIFCSVGDSQPNRTVAEIAAGEGRQPSSLGSGSGDPAGAR